MVSNQRCSIRAAACVACFVATTTMLHGCKDETELMLRRLQQTGHIEEKQNDAFNGETVVGHQVRRMSSSHGVGFIRDRIATVKNTKKITEAMKLVAAADVPHEVRHAQDAVLAARVYSGKIQSMVGGLIQKIQKLGGKTSDLPLLSERKEVKTLTLAVFTRDQDLGVIKKAETRFKELNNLGVEVNMVLIGGKGISYFTRGKYPIRKTFECGQNPDAKQALAISEELLSLFLAGESDAIELVYTKFVSLIASTLSVRTLVPFSASEFTQNGDEVFQLTSESSDFSVERTEPDVAKPQIFPNDMIFKQEPLQILNSLLSQYINAEILRTLQESVASELAAHALANKNLGGKNNLGKKAKDQ